ncbi:MAG: response regulator transcription factor [Chloroflexi bacterium]|nr:response regulator transcription factor [Chloroflexota bacterium]MCI0577945.1 response regulator transcription factor [Chloroflexota bacterium]MCI0646107.1 response regulator transcription factor [Chloroflexota bacterium]MCI0731567.1 response regulator transcription factor [Chloroflexota bacterium]
MAPQKVESIRVMLVDDHHLVRLALGRLLQNFPDLEVIAQAADGLEAVELYGQHKPDVAVMDVHMPKMNGFQATEEILRQFPRARIVILTGIDHPAYTTEARAAGAAAFLDKKAAPEQLAEVIRNVHAGRITE